MKIFNKVILFFFLSTSFMQGVSAQYYTGQKIFSNKFPTEILDRSQDTYIKINNTSGDIIVAVENTRTGRVIQHAYITSHDTYTFNFIPVGDYVCKYMWTDSSGNRHYEKDVSKMSFDVDEYGGYEITLQETIYGNHEQSKISESDFFN
jgi:hypothetical protein